MADFGLKREDSTVTKPQVNTELLSNIKTRPQLRHSSDMEESDRVAANSGFTSREPGTREEPLVRPILKKPKQKQRYALSIMPTVETRNRFHFYAETRNLSYPQALERLLEESEDLAVLRGEK